MSSYGFNTGYQQSYYGNQQYYYGNQQYYGRQMTPEEREKQEKQQRDYIAQGMAHESNRANLYNTLSNNYDLIAGLDGDSSSISDEDLKLASEGKFTDEIKNTALAFVNYIKDGLKGKDKDFDGDGKLSKDETAAARMSKKDALQLILDNYDLIKTAGGVHGKGRRKRHNEDKNNIQAKDLEAMIKNTEDPQLKAACFKLLNDKDLFKSVDRAGDHKNGDDGRINARDLEMSIATAEGGTSTSTSQPSYEQPFQSSYPSPLSPPIFV